LGDPNRRTNSGGRKDSRTGLDQLRFAWLSVGGFLDPQPGAGHGPIKQDPDIPFRGNNQGPGLVTPPMGNYKDTVLKPWAAAQDARFQ
jgi:hypothetical protein